MAVVYQLLFSNGKSYIGATKNLKRRLGEIKNNKRNGKVTTAWKDLGQPQIIILYKSETDNFLDLKEIEEKFVKELNTLFPNGYNSTPHGQGGPYDIVPNNETIEKLKIARKGRKPNLGNFHSYETRAKMMAAHRKRHHGID